MADAARFGIEQRRRGRDLDDRSGLSEHKVDVEQQILTDFHFDPGLHRGSKAGRRNTDIVNAGIQRRNDVPSEFIGEHLCGDVGAFVGDGHGRGRYHGLIRIENRADNATGLNLSRHRRHKQRQQDSGSSGDVAQHHAVLLR
jgi:hypothetical protein